MGKVKPVWEPEDSRIDRTRDRVRIDNLDERERKTLFRQFLAHGGQVLGEELKKNRGEILRRSSKRTGNGPAAGVSTGVRYTKGLGDKGAETPGMNVRDRSSSVTHAKGALSGAPFKKGTDVHAGKSVHNGGALTMTGEPGASEAYTEAVTARAIDLSRWKSSFGDRLKIQLKGYQQNIFTFGGRRLDGRFVGFLKKEVRESLKELRLALDSIVSGEVRVINEIIRVSTGENSTFYEVLLRLCALYDEQEYEGILRSVASRTIPRRSALPLIAGFFKRLYILGQNSSICRMCAMKAVDIQGRECNINADVIQSVRDQLCRVVDLVLGELCVKTHLLLCKILRVYLPLYSRELDELLGVTNEDMLGYITLMQRRKRIEEMKKARETMEKTRETSSIEVPPHIESGLPLLRRSIERYEDLYLESDVKELGKGDRLYVPLALLDIFDKEYSFILTTGKISFNIDFRNQKKINVKEDLSYAYLLLNEAWEEAKNYLDIVREIRGNESNIRITPYQKFVTEKTLERKRSLVGRSAQRKISEVMKAIEGNLGLVIADYNSNGRLLQNPDEVLEFDQHIDGVKNVDGKTVMDSIMEAYLFCAAVPFMIQLGENDLNARRPFSAEAST